MAMSYWFTFDAQPHAWKLSDAGRPQLCRQGKRAGLIPIATYASVEDVELLSGTHPDWTVALTELYRLVTLTDWNTRAFGGATV